MSASPARAAARAAPARPASSRHTGPRHPGELALTLVLLGLVLLIGWEAARITGTTPSGPGFGPLAMVAVAGLGLSARLVQLVVVRSGERQAVAARLRRLTAAVLPGPVVVTLPLLLLYLVGLELVGFVPASFAFLVLSTGLLWRLDRLRGRELVRRGLLALAVAAGTVAVIRLIFQELFQVLLP